MRNRFSIAILFCITTTATVFGQVSEAEDKVAELLLSEADFPKRYAVHCDYEELLGARHLEFPGTWSSRADLNITSIGFRLLPLVFNRRGIICQLPAR